MTYDLDKLTELARNIPTKKQEKIFQPDEEKRANAIVKFCATYSIKNGTQKVPTADIFKLYKKWEQTHTTQRLKRVDFFRLFSRMFQSGRNGKTRYYYLNVGLDNEKEND